MKDDPLAVAKLCVEDIQRHRESIAELARLRKRAIQKAIDGGMSQYAVAKELGITPQAVAKILGRS
jgi:predicted secreted Zn-dependent protease